MTRLTLDLSERDGVVLAKLDGEIDFSNARSIGDQLLGAVSNESAGIVLTSAG